MIKVMTLGNKTYFVQLNEIERELVIDTMKVGALFVNDLTKFKSFDRDEISEAIAEVQKIKKGGKSPVVMKNKDVYILSCGALNGVDSLLTQDKIKTDEDSRVMLYELRKIADSAVKEIDNWVSF